MQLHALGDPDPERTARVREWLAQHKDFEFFRDHHRQVWWVTDGRRGGPPPQPSRRRAHRPAPPDSIA